MDYIYNNKNCITIMKVRYDKHREVFTITEADRVEYHQVKLHLTRYVKNHRFDPRVKMGVWDGRVSLFKDGEFSLGLWKEVYDLCKLNKWDFVIENKEDFPTNKKVTLESVKAFCEKFFKNHVTKDGKKFFPYDHQIESAYKILRSRYCLSEVATGGGKSLIFAIVAFYILSELNPKCKFLLIVPSISLVTQFYDEIVNYNKGINNENLDFLDIKICEIMSDKPRRDEGECNIFIGTFQSLEKRDAEFFKQFNVVTTDECLHPDTNITMGDDSIKKISQVNVGDLVKTVNEVSGDIEIKEIDYIYKNLSKNQQMYEIELENGEILKITGNHKVRIKGNKIWKRVDELTLDDEIIYIDKENGTA